jgi:hypothetical protein
VLVLVPATADQFEVIRSRLRQEFYPSASSLPSVVAAARASLRTLNASCYWPDINYADQTRANWGAIVHLSRVSTLVQAATTPGSPAFEEAALMQGLHCSLQAWLTRSPRFSNPNWWYRWIGEELSLQSSFLLLGANRTTPAEFQGLTQFSYSSAWWVNDWGGGDNLSDMLRVQLYRGVASSNLTAVEQAFATLFSTAAVVHVTDGKEGPTDDSAYLFHGIQMLSSAYGAGWVSTLLSTLSVSAGTPWAMPDAAVAVLARFLAEGDLAITFGSSWDFGTQGRGIDRPGLDFSWGFAGSGLQLLANASAASPWAPSLRHFAALLEGNSSVQQQPSSHHFWTVDFYAHKRPTWGATFKGYGNNGLWAVVGNECDNSENIVGEYTGAGVLNVYASSELQGAAREPYEGIFPLWDWVRINGVSAEARPPVVCNSSTSSQWPVRNTAYVGGASNGASGAVAHDFALHSLTGQRSFHFLAEAVLAVASNLTNAPSALPVRTALVSRLLPDPALTPRGRVALGFSNATTLASLPDGSYSFAAGEVAWVNGGGVGVLLPPGAPPLGLELGTVSGNYHTIGPFSGAVSGRLLTVWYAHGSAVSHAAAHYTLAPNATAEAMPALAARGAGVACVSGGEGQEELHVAVSGGAGEGELLVSAVVWAQAGGAYPGCPALGQGAGSFSLSSDAILLLGYNATHATATLAHPALWAAGGRRTVTQARALLPSPGCSGLAMQLTLPGKGPFMGSSVSLACALA